MCYTIVINNVYNQSQYFSCKVSTGAFLIAAIDILQECKISKNL